MNDLKRSPKLQLIIGFGGSVLTMILWKAAGFFLTRNLPASVLTAINAFAILSLTFTPILVMVLAKDSPADYGISKVSPIRQILTGIGIGLAMGAVLTLFPLLMGWKQLVYIGSPYHTFFDAIAGLFYFIFIVGLSEEFVFRGFIYSKLNDICLSDEMPIVLSSLLFGLMHGFSPVKLISTALIGAFFCICRKNIPHCSLFSLAIAHGIHDWLIRVLPTFF